MEPGAHRDSFHGSGKGALWRVNELSLGTGDGGDAEFWRGDGALSRLKHCEFPLRAALTISRSAQQQRIPVRSVEHPSDGQEAVSSCSG
jgi:hypothetical protein